jgi:hypothetical protein
MTIPRIPRRWQLRTLMILVALCAVGLGADGVSDVRGLVDGLIGQLRTGNARTRSEAARRLGLLGPRAAPSIGVPLTTFTATLVPSDGSDPDVGEGGDPWKSGTLTAHTGTDDPVTT